MNSVCIVELLIKLSYINILSGAQQYVHAKFLSPSTIQRTVGLSVKCLLLQRNKRMFVLLWPSSDLQLG